MEHGGRHCIKPYMKRPNIPVLHTSWWQSQSILSYCIFIYIFQSHYQWHSVLLHDFSVYFAMQVSTVCDITAWWIPFLWSKIRWSCALMLCVPTQFTLCLYTLLNSDVWKWIKHCLNVIPLHFFVRVCDFNFLFVNIILLLKPKLSYFLLFKTQARKWILNTGAA